MRLMHYFPGLFEFNQSCTAQSHDEAVCLDDVTVIDHEASQRDESILSLYKPHYLLTIICAIFS